MPKTKNFTIRDASKTSIKVRACPETSGGKLPGAMILQPIYKDPYTLALASVGATLRTGSPGGVSPPATYLVSLTRSAA